MPLDCADNLAQRNKRNGLWRSVPQKIKKYEDRHIKEHGQMMIAMPECSVHSRQRSKERDQRTKTDPFSIFVRKKEQRDAKREMSKERIVCVPFILIKRLILRFRILLC